MTKLRENEVRIVDALFHEMAERNNRGLSAEYRRARRRPRSRRPGPVIVHPDVSTVQRDFSSLTHVEVARRAGSGPVTGAVQVARDINGREVLAIYAPVASRNLGWLVLVELPVEEAK